MQEFPISIYNTLSRKVELFKPIDSGRVGMYVCGPTVYGPAHLGHARSAIAFDVVIRTLRHWGYAVRYVRNITDVGHLVNDEDEGEDKVGRVAHLQRVSPMEVVHAYMRSYHEDLDLLNVLPPSIEPQASGHIVEQIELVDRLMRRGYAYSVNGSVYFDVGKYDSCYGYGVFANRSMGGGVGGRRSLIKQGEKRSVLDFALWKAASPSHVMRWLSPWGEGFPGWHVECTAMSNKYLGGRFDIHGGGLDLCFPHHECGIAQSRVAYGVLQPANYWMHNNLVTIEDAKMSKSSGNYISLKDLFEGSHVLLSEAYAPMVLRFLMLQAHYRSTLKFSEQAIQAAKRGYVKLLNVYKTLQEMEYCSSMVVEGGEGVNTCIRDLCEACYRAISYDFNTAKVIGYLFALGEYVHAVSEDKLAMHHIEKGVWQELEKVYRVFMEDILGLSELPTMDSLALVEGLVEVYRRAKAVKNYEEVDRLRLLLKKQGVRVEDGRFGIRWRYDS